MGGRKRRGSGSRDLIQFIQPRSNALVGQILRPGSAPPLCGCGASRWAAPTGLGCPTFHFSFNPLG
eukprot:5890838-Amphidinium_carterae.1